MLSSFGAQLATPSGTRVKEAGSNPRVSAVSSEMSGLLGSFLPSAGCGVHRASSELRPPTAGVYRHPPKDPEIPIQYFSHHQNKPSRLLVHVCHAETRTRELGLCRSATASCL